MGYIIGNVRFKSALVSWDLQGFIREEVFKPYVYLSNLLKIALSSLYNSVSVSYKKTTYRTN